MPKGSSTEAEDQIDRIQKGDVGVISMLVLMEMVDVIRKLVTESIPFNGNNEDERKKIKERVKEEISKYIDVITGLAAEGKIQIIDPNVSIKDHFKESFKLLQLLDYRINDYSTCRLCGAKIQPKYSSKALGQYDIQHALIAKQIGCDEIITSDKSFKELEKKLSLQQNCNYSHSLSIPLFLMHLF
jgi:predicted nucleic acid-binding protein